MLGLDSDRDGRGLVCFDYDNDGDVDLFIGNEHGHEGTAACQLFRNNGDGTFTDVAREAGVADRAYVKSLTPEKKEVTEESGS